MKINVDRLAVLAGIGSSSNSPGLMSEGKKAAEETEEAYHSEADEADDAMEEMIEVDEVMLVQELRRAKKMMLEASRQQRKQNLQESKLQRIIEEEVENIFGELNLNSDWVYGDNRPKRSRAGYTAQGSFLKGLGFK